MRDLTVFVNTSDNFEDCWKPFFTLFRHYWPNCPYPVVLNTESKEFAVDGIELRCTKVAASATRRLTWSECLARALETVETPYLLYLQEDYFLEGPVQTELFEPLLAEMRAGLRADVVRIKECGGSGPWHETGNELLWQVDAQSKYLISLQAALWRTDFLKRQLRLHESPWQLEIFGSPRARRQGGKVLCVNRDKLSEPHAEIFPYQATGVISGQWEEKIVVPLFAKHGIAMDFSQRGFYDSRSPLTKKKPIFNRLYDRLRSL